jgi:hypothetical protein
MHAILTFIKRLISMSFQSLQHRFVDWTKPASTSLMVGTVTDLARRKSELVAENALLRQQLIVLRRHVKRPTCCAGYFGYPFQNEEMDSHMHCFMKNLTEVCSLASL